MMSPSSAVMRQCSTALCRAALVLGVAAPVATPAATVYKWTDEKGVVNYTTVAPDKRLAQAIDATPAVEGKGQGAGYDEARYWRERAQREALRDLQGERLQSETELLRQQRLRQEIAAAEAQTKQKTEAQLRQEQCRAERRVDCDSASYGGAPYGGAMYGYGYGGYAPGVVVVQRPGRASAPASSFFSITSNFTPGFSKPLVYSNPR